MGTWTYIYKYLEVSVAVSSRAERSHGVFWKDLPLCIVHLSALGSHRWTQSSWVWTPLQGWGSAGWGPQGLPKTAWGSPGLHGGRKLQVLAPRHCRYLWIPQKRGYGLTQSWTKGKRAGRECSAGSHEDESPWLCWVKWPGRQGGLLQEIRRGSLEEDPLIAPSG